MSNSTAVSTAQQTLLNQANQIRRSVAAAYADVQGDEITESFSAITFEECLDRQIEAIEGAGTDIRPNLLDRVQKVKSTIMTAIQQINSLPDDAFTQADPDRNTVTDVATPISP